VGAPHLFASSFGALSILLLTATPASAFDRNDINYSVDLRDYYLHTMPRFDLSDLHTPLRTVSTSGSLPSVGQEHFLGVTIDSTFLRNGRWEFPLFGMTLAGAIGECPRVITSVDGSIITLRPWTAGAFTLLLPGIGVRTNERRWKLAVTARAILSVTWMNITVANGAQAADPTDDPATSSGALAGTFGVRADFTVCRRLDPSQRVCAFVSPHLYEFSPLNGFSAGLRMEWGP
jgi:hypothetical protein